MTHSVSGQLSQSDINYRAGIDLAKKLAAQGEYDVARLLCERILRDNPESSEPYFIIGNTYAWEGRFDKARLFYYRVFEFENANMDAFIQLISLELWDGDAQGAIELANTALKNNPLETTVLLQKAKAQIMLGDFFNAKKSLFVLLSEDPNNSEASQLYRNIVQGVSEEIIINDHHVLAVQPVDSIFKRAQRMAWDQNFELAHENISLILAAKPDYWPAYVLWAQTYAWQNDYTKARKIIEVLNLENNVYREGIVTAIDIELWDKKFDKAIEKVDNLGLKNFPGDREFLFKKAEIYRAQGNVFQAKEIVYQLLKDDPTDYRAIQYYNEIRGDSSRDRKDYRTSIQTQATQRGLDMDAWLIQAKEYANEQRYSEAQAICVRILDVYPDDYETQILMGRTLAWLGRFSEARAWYEKLLLTSFDSYELIGAIVDLETWDHNYPAALERINYGLQIYPNDKEYLKKKLAIYQRSGEVELSEETLQHVIGLYPDDKDIKKFYFGQMGLTQINGVSAEYTYNTYKLPFLRTWKMYSVRYFNSNDQRTLVGSINTGYVSSDTSSFSVRGGYQFEVDAYPIFKSKKRYFHVNYGFSPSNVFARHRLGAHIYQEFMPTWELMAGMNYTRYRSVTDTTNLFMFQVGVTKYWESFMASFITNFAPTPLKISQGYTLTGRKFLGRADNWIQLSISAGVYPENPAFYLNDLSITPLGLLNSYTVFTGFRYLFKEKWIGQIFLGYQSQEYMAATLRDSWTVNLALIYLLK